VELSTTETFSTRADEDVLAAWSCARETCWSRPPDGHEPEYAWTMFDPMDRVRTFRRGIVPSDRHLPSHPMVVVIRDGILETTTRYLPSHLGYRRDAAAPGLFTVLAVLGVLFIGASQFVRMPGFLKTFVPIAFAATTPLLYWWL
jgi:hypothetical protein